MNNELALEWADNNPQTINNIEHSIATSMRSYAQEVVICVLPDSLWCVRALLEDAGYEITSIAMLDYGVLITINLR